MTNFTRRDFLKIGAAGTATAILAGCSQEAERWVNLEPYVRPPEEQLAGVPTWYASTCRMCPAGCGILARIMNGRAVKIEGNPEHPVNRGKLCPRGQAGLQLLYNPDRVTGAVQQNRRGDRKFTAIPWNEAINTLYEKLNAAGAGVGVWVGSSTSGHLVDLFTRFAKAVGAPDPVRYDLYSGLNGYDVLAQISGTYFGRTELPSYDLGHADTIFSFGADFLGPWLSTTAYGVEFGDFRSQTYGRRGYLVQFEPKMSICGAKADRWVPIQPGADGLVAQAIIKIIADQKLGSSDRIDRASKLASDVSIDDAAAACELPVDMLVELARVFAVAEHPVALPGPALIGRNNGVGAAMTVQALNVIVGTVGQPGGMTLTPALPESSLAAPMSSSFAQAQALIEQMQNGDIKVLLIHGANPAYDLPHDAGFIEALDKVETFVSFNTLVDETSAYADYMLPDRVYLEGWGYEVVRPGFQGLPVVGSQQPVVGPLYDVRPTGDVLLTAAKGIPAAAAVLPWTDEVAFIKEMVSALPKGANGGDDVDVRLARFQQHGGWWPETPQYGAVEASGLATIQVSPTTFQGDEKEYKYFLHAYLSVALSDGSGASIPWLQGTPDPMTTISWQTWVELNPATAKELGVENGDIVKVESPHGEIEAPVYVFPAIRPDTVAMPFGQGHSDYGRYAKDRGSQPMQLISAELDETGNNLAWASVRVKLTRTGNKKKLALLETTVEQSTEIPIPF
jgi:anaerobic selenocysteine-containing dehydrogenase